MNWCENDSSVKMNLQIETATKERALALEMRDRLERVRPDRDNFLAKLKAERATVYKVMLGFSVMTSLGQCDGAPVL